MGFTTKENTILTISNYYDDKLEFNIEEIKSVLMNYKLKKRWIKNEIYIINNELSCMSDLYQSDYGKCENDNYLDYKK
ncbi:MAG: hypothetical protein E7214_16970 [Clostridium sp.]|nr:hypothetical protein [Clostridium sp.]